MAAVYTSRLIHAGATASAAFTCPADKLCVVRDINLLFDGASTSDAYSVAIGGVYLLSGQVDGGAVALVRWEGRQALEQGEQLVFSASTVNWYVLITGYLLYLP